MEFKIEINFRRKLQRGLSRRARRILAVMLREHKAGNASQFSEADLAGKTGVTEAEVNQAFIEFGLRGITRIVHADSGKLLSDAEVAKLARETLPGIGFPAEGM